MQKWNVPIDIAQRVGAKNGAICLFTWLFTELRLLKCQKWLFYFSADEGKKSVTVWLNS